MMKTKRTIGAETGGHSFSAHQGDTVRLPDPDPDPYPELDGGFG